MRSQIIVMTHLLRLINFFPEYPFHNKYKQMLLLPFGNPCNQYHHHVQVFFMLRSKGFYEHTKPKIRFLVPFEGGETPLE